MTNSLKMLIGLNMMHYRLWVKPDGQWTKISYSNYKSYGEDFEVVFTMSLQQLHEPQLLTLKFEDFIGKNKGAIFDPS